MTSSDIRRMWGYLVLLAVCLICPAVRAQQNVAEGGGLAGEFYTSTLPFAVPDPEKIIPVRILREFEMGPELERFASSANRLVERREKELTEAAWKIDGNTTVTATAIMVRDAGNPTLRHLGARLGYSGPKVRATNDGRSVHVVDLDELRHMELDLSGMIRAMEQMPPRSESVSYQYRCRSGFTIALTMTQKENGVAYSAVVDKVTADSRERARQIFEEGGSLLHRVIQHLLTM